MSFFDKIEDVTYQFLISGFSVILWTHRQMDADKNNTLQGNK